MVLPDRWKLPLGPQKPTSQAEAVALIARRVGRRESFIMVAGSVGQLCVVEGLCGVNWILCENSLFCGYCSRHAGTSAVQSAHLRLLVLSGPDLADSKALSRVRLLLSLSSEVRASYN